MMYVSQRPCHRCISIAQEAGIYRIDYPGAQIVFLGDGYVTIYSDTDADVTP
jgi:deoxycytidylate deaminase